MGKDKRYNFTALLLCALACCGWSYVLDLKYYRLTYYSWDLPLYANLMWNLCHGQMSTSLFGGNFLVDHFNGIAFLLVPFYYFFQSPLTILYFKLFAFFLGAYVFYLLAAKRVGGLGGIALMLVYMFYPANVAMIFFEFNFENLALPVIFLMFYFFEENKFFGFMSCCLLMAIIKENMPLVVFMFGLYGLMVKKDDRLRWGLYPLLLGAGMFFGEVFIFIPWMRHGLDTTNTHWYLYSQLGKSPLEMIKTFIFNEPKVFKLLFDGHNLSFLSALFGPLLIAALLAPHILFLAAPLFLQDLLSNSFNQQSIYFFYSSTLTVFIFMAAIDLLGRINTKFRVYLWGLLAIFLVNFDLGYAHEWRDRAVPFQEKQAAVQYILSKIPPDAKIISSYKFLYLLSQRKDLYVLYLKREVFTDQPEVVPDSVDYMMIDFDSRVDNRKIVRQLLLHGHWKVQAAVDDMIFLRKNTAYGERLISSDDHPFPFIEPLQKPLLKISSALSLEEVKIPASLKFGRRIMRVVFYWRALKDNKNIKLPKISMSIFQSFGRYYLKENAPFYGLPVKKGKYYRQVYYYFIPQLSPGKYKVVITSVPPKGKDQRPIIPPTYPLKIFY